MKRANALAKFSTDGPKIVNTYEKYKAYILEIEQEIFDEEDAKIGCQNYPTELFSTFNDCDQNYTRNWMEKHMPNLVPVWASRSINETTIHKSDVTQSQSQSIPYSRFIIGLHRSDCSLPCKTTRISTR